MMRGMHEKLSPPRAKLASGEQIGQSYLGPPNVNLFLPFPTASEASGSDPLSCHASALHRPLELL